MIKVLFRCGQRRCSESVSGTFVSGKHVDNLIVFGLKSVRKKVTSGAGDPAWLPLPTVEPSTMASHGMYECGHSPGDGTGVGRYVGEEVGSAVG